jgi:hypothetical protein
MKKILMISAFYLENNTSRPYHMKLYFEQKGFKVKVITTNFNHSTKRKEKIDSSNVVQLNVPSYSKTLSFKRIFSHMIFAYKIRKFIKSEEYDLIYVAVPPNLSSYFASKIAAHRKKIIIVDIIDIWPQNNNKGVFAPIYKIWQKWRDIAISKSNILLLETTAYIEKVNSINNNYNLVYIAKPTDISFNLDETLEMRKDFKRELKIAYLGNFSDSYDFDSLVFILEALKSFNASLIIIGDGPLKSEVLEKITSKQIFYQDYGIVFDEMTKGKILNQCHFGYNAVKESTLVGLSYKSIDYLSFSLPLINSVKYDTCDLIETYHAGINFNAEKLNELILHISSLTFDGYLQMISGAKELFDAHFSIDSFYNTMESILQQRGVIDETNNSI